MSRYIDADKLHPDKLTVGGTLAISQSQIAEQPTADVRENRHGEWIVKDESYWRPHHSGDISVNKAGLYCSECDKRLAKAQKYRNYCPNCGARMECEEE